MYTKEILEVEPDTGRCEETGSTVSGRNVTCVAVGIAEIACVSVSYLVLPCGAGEGTVCRTVNKVVNRRIIRLALRTAHVVSFKTQRASLETSLASIVGQVTIVAIGAVEQTLVV